MATPTGARADAARGYFARVRRRKKQDQKDFDTAGHAPAPFRVLLMAVNAGGSGYNVGDQFLIDGGTFYIQASGYVVAAPGGVVSTVAVLESGAYSTAPTNPLTTTNITGTGTGLQINATLSRPFGLGITPANGSSANGLVLPADCYLTLIHQTFATSAGNAGMGILDETTGVLYRQAEPAAALGHVNFRHLFREGHTVKTYRNIVTPLGAVWVYFRGPKSQLIQVASTLFA